MQNYVNHIVQYISSYKNNIESFNDIIKDAKKKLLK